MAAEMLDIDIGHQIHMPISAVIGESIAVLGIKGSGKTNTAAVLIEELLAKGLPMAIVDIEGEYWGLRERFDILVAGKSPHVDLEVSPDQAGQLAEFSLLQNVPVILDVSEFEEDQTHSFLLAFFERLWKLNFTHRKPYQVVLEEAHEFVPQGTRNPLKQVLTRFALRGRKRGFGLISISQRSAKVEKDILTQAGIAFLHRVVHPVDIKVYQDIIPLPARQVEEMIAQLGNGQAIALFNNQVEVIHVRLRHTFHAGATPELDESVLPSMRKIDDSTLAALQKVLEQPSKLNHATGDCEQLTRRIKELEALLRQKTSEHQKLKTVEPAVQRKPADPKLAKNGKPKAAIQTKENDQPFKSSLAVKRDSNRDEKFFALLLTRVHKTQKFQQVVLRFLTEYEGRTFSARDLARSLDLSTSTIEKWIPGELGSMGLISRTSANGKWSYTSSARILFKAEYSGLNADDLMDRLIAALPEKPGKPAKV